MRIGRKLAVTHGIMSLLLIGLVFGAKLVVDRIERDFDTLHSEFSSAIEELNNLRAAGLQIISSTNGFAFIVSTKTDPFLSNEVYKKSGAASDNEAETNELEELDDGIAAFNQAFVRYTRAVGEYSLDEALTLPVT